MSEDPQFKLLSKEEIEKNRIKSHKYIDMKKEKTPIEELINELRMFYAEQYAETLPSWLEQKSNELLTKERKQREELIKEVCIKSYTSGLESALSHNVEIGARTAEQYYNEVTKGRN